MSAQIRLISAEKYLDLIKQKLPSLVSLDVTWYPAGKDGRQEYVKEHIANAHYFDFGKVSTQSKYPHTMPRDFAEFKKTAGAEGLRKNDYIVVYDQATYLSGPRVAWLLSTFGHPNVFLLDNYKEYKKLGGAVESGEGKPLPSQEYQPSTDAEPESVGTWLNYEDILQLLESGDAAKYNIIDARGAGRFSGSDAEPRAGIQSGHIPGSKNIPFPLVVDTDGHFKSKEELQKLFTEREVDPAKPSIVLCGSGVTACVVKAAADEAFGTNALVYDGSWSEWGQRAPEKYIEKSQ